MEITWLGHSALRVSSGDFTLITDPYADSVGFEMPQQDAQIVTISNEHPHHSHVDAVNGAPRVLSGPGEYEVGNFYISGIGTSLDPGDGESERRINTVFIIRSEGLTLCHLGDLNQTLSPRLSEELNELDILVVPAGGHCTVSSLRAAEVVNLVSPRIVIPIHYRTEGLKVELEGLDAFLEELGAPQVAGQPRLDVTASNLPREMRVSVLQRAT